MKLVDMLKTLPPNQYTFRRIFLLMTRMLYADPNNYGSLADRFSRFIWSKDKKLSTLEVESDFSYDPANLDTVPSIYVGCGAITYATSVINNQAGSNPDRSASEHQRNASCPVKLTHITKSPDEVQQLGDLTAQYYLGMQTLFQTRMNIRSYEVAMLTEVRPVKTSNEKADKQFSVDLIINLGFNASWLTFTESSRIKTMTFGQTLQNFDRD